MPAPAPPRPSGRSPAPGGAPLGGEVRDAADDPGRRRLARLRPDTRAAVFLFLFLFGFYALWAGGHSYSSDEEGYLQQALSLTVGRHDIDLTQENLRVTASRPGRDGAAVAGGNLGAPVAAVPLALVGRAAGSLADETETAVVERLFIGFTNAWITALTAVVVFLLARELGAARRPSLLLALVFGVGTFAWAYSGTLLFSEPLTALLTAAGALFAVRAGNRRPFLWAPLAGLAAGLAILARSSALPFVGVIGLYVAWVMVRRRGLVPAIGPVLAYVGGAVVALGVVAATNAWRYGESVETGYAGIQPLTGSFWTGFHGLFFSPGKTLFLYAPIALVALAAIPLALRRRPAETLMLLGVIAANVYIFARFPQWHGDQAWGPRYLIITLPLVVALCAPALAALPGDLSRLWRRGVVAAGVVGVVLSLGGAALYANQYFFIAQQALTAQLAPGQPPGDLFRPLRYDPDWSPAQRHLRLLNDVAASSTDRIDGDDESFRLYGNFPSTTASRYFWYFAPAQLDTWWYYVFPQGTSKVPLLLVPAFLGVMVVGVRGLRREARRRYEPAAAVPAPAVVGA